MLSSLFLSSSFHPKCLHSYVDKLCYLVTPQSVPQFVGDEGHTAVQCQNSNFEYDAVDNVKIEKHTKNHKPHKYLCCQSQISMLPMYAFSRYKYKLHISFIV